MKNYLIKFQINELTMYTKNLSAKKGLPEKIQTALFFLMNKTKRLQE